MDEINSAIAVNLKRLRGEKKVSMDVLAQLSGVSKSMIGQIERGEVNPTISTMWKIANGLKVPFTELITIPQTDMERIDIKSMTPLLGADGSLRNYPLFPFDRERPFEILYLEIDPGTFMEAEPHPDGAQEFVVVFSGTLEVGAGDASAVVGEGCAIRFGADRKHWYRNVGEAMCRVSMVISYRS